MAEGFVKTQPSGYFVRGQTIVHQVDPPVEADAQPVPPPAAQDDPRIDGCKGWIVVLGSFIIHVWAIGMSYAFGVFIKPLQKEFDVQREPIVWLNGLFSFSLLFGGIGTGYLADRCASSTRISIVRVFILVVYSPSLSLSFYLPLSAFLDGPIGT